MQLDEKILEKYVGTYELQKGFNLSVTLEEGKLKLQATGQEKNEILQSLKRNSL
ncbi:MAG: DUF3471 domain-containing protein [Chloroflexia bacterium]|nr:DUF3471 domain-containing protein [Chloroflexia bacterium]